MLSATVTKPPTPGRPGIRAFLTTLHCAGLDESRTKDLLELELILLCCVERPRFHSTP